MTLSQISVFIENKPGVLVSVTSALSDAGVDVRALSLADTLDFGILRMIVNDTETARNALKEAGFVSSVTDVLVAEVPDETGAMTLILKKTAETGLNIEYIYAFVSPKNKKAYIVLRIKDIELAEKELKAKGIKLAENPNEI